jgi:hypothetical protein
MAGSSKITTDRDTIRSWAIEREGKPAIVAGTAGKKGPGVLRIDFPGGRGKDSLEEITWEDFFEEFEEKKLALLYQDETSGGKISRFNKIIKRETGNRSAINNMDRKKDLEMENQQNPEEFDMDEYADLLNKDIEELKAIAEQKEIPNPEEFNKEELVMAIELADLAEE